MVKKLFFCLLIFCSTLEPMAGGQASFKKVAKNFLVAMVIQQGILYGSAYSAGYENRPVLRESAIQDLFKATKIIDPRALSLIKSVEDRVATGKIKIEYYGSSEKCSYLAIVNTIILDNNDLVRFIELDKKLKSTPFGRKTTSLQNEHDYLSKTISVSLAHEIRHVENKDSLRGLSFILANGSLGAYASYWWLFAKKESHKVIKNSFRLPFLYAGLFAFNKYHAAYREYVADIQAGRIMGSAACYAQALNFENLDKQECKNFNINAGIAQERLVNYFKNRQPGCSFLDSLAQGGLEKVKRLDLDWWYNVIFRFTPVYALLSVHPSHQARMRYLRELGDTLKSDVSK